MVGNAAGNASSRKKQGLKITPKPLFYLFDKNSLLGVVSINLPNGKAQPRRSNGVGWSDLLDDLIS